MCNRYQNRTMAAEVASLFDVEASNVSPFNVGGEVYPNYPGMVVRVHEGERHLDAMNWGFPLRTRDMKPDSKAKPVNNARDDKLLTGIWRDSFAKRRCLIPMTAWAEAEGPKGQMTCTWLSLHGSDLFAVAGIWRPTDEWGNCYSMVMVNGCAQMAGIHTRMPVILRPENYDRWMLGTPEEAHPLVSTCDDQLVVDRTPDLWKARPAPTASALL